MKCEPLPLIFQMLMCPSMPVEQVSSEPVESQDVRGATKILTLSCFAVGHILYFNPSFQCSS